jgi:hypothetical protein
VNGTIWSSQFPNLISLRFVYDWRLNGARPHLTNIYPVFTGFCFRIKISLATASKGWIMDGYCLIIVFTGHVLCLQGLRSLMYLSCEYRSAPKSNLLKIPYIAHSFNSFCHSRTLSCKECSLFLIVCSLRSFSRPCSAISLVWLRHRPVSQSLPGCLLPYSCRLGFIGRRSFLGALKSGHLSLKKPRSVILGDGPKDLSILTGFRRQMRTSEAHFV